MKIYDCFTFYNELDLLDLRLSELYDHVDHFVIVEATTTFQNNHKPLFLKDNWDRYAQYQDKIIHVVVDDMPLNTDPWQNERFQRDAILRGLVNADADDIAIIGDVDEILRTSSIDTIRQDTKQVYGFRMPYFNFKFNYMLVNDVEMYCIWTTASRVGLLSSPEDLRRSRWDLHNFTFGYQDQAIKILENSGWHFTYLGNNEQIRTKLKSFAHKELNRDSILNAIDVDAMIARGAGHNPENPRSFVCVALDDYFPRTLLENKDKYNQYIIAETDSTATEYLPK